jgi:hypothetical protein
MSWLQRILIKSSSLNSRLQLGKEINNGLVGTVYDSCDRLPLMRSWYKLASTNAVNTTRLLEVGCIVRYFFFGSPACVLPIVLDFWVSGDRVLQYISDNRFILLMYPWMRFTRSICPCQCCTEPWHCHPLCDDINPGCTTHCGAPISDLVDLGIFMIEWSNQRVLGDHLYEWAGGVLGFSVKGTFAWWVPSCGPKWLESSPCMTSGMYIRTHARTSPQNRCHQVHRDPMSLPSSAATES